MDGPEGPHLGVESYQPFKVGDVSRFERVAQGLRPRIAARLRHHLPNAGIPPSLFGGPGATTLSA